MIIIVPHSARLLHRRVLTAVMQEVLSDSCTRHRKLKISQRSVVILRGNLHRRDCEPVGSFLIAKIRKLTLYQVQPGYDVGGLAITTVLHAELLT
jgi:hypothetical protein